MGRLPSWPLVPPQHHVGVLTRSLPLMLKRCGMIQRQPGWPTPWSRS